jgi:hypothetical protein
VQRDRRARTPDPYHERDRPSEQDLPHPKKVGALPIGDDDQVKQTNEIKMAIPLLEAIDIAGVDSQTIWASIS